MKKAIFIIFLIPIFLKAQEVVYEKSGYEILNDTVWFRVDTLIYDNGNQAINKTLIGDSLTFVTLLAKDEYLSYDKRAKHQAFALKEIGLGESGRLLELITGDNYYKYSTDKLEANFSGNWTIRYNNVTYDASSAKIGNLLKFQATNLGLYTLYPLSARSFVLLNFFGAGNHLEVFMTDEQGDKRLFWNDTKTVRIVYTGA